MLPDAEEEKVMGRVLLAKLKVGVDAPLLLCSKPFSSDLRATVVSHGNSQRSHSKRDASPVAGFPLGGG